MTLRLEQSWLAEPPPHGGFRFQLHNLGEQDLAPVKLCYSAMTRLARDVRVEGGRLLRTFGNHVEIAPGSALPAGGALEVRLLGLTHPPKNRSQGAMAAWIELADGTAIAAEVGDLAAPEGGAAGPIKDWPAGRLELPLFLLPWPAEIAVGDLAPPRPLYPAAPGIAQPMAKVAALHRRLHPADPAPFTLEQVPGGRAVAAREDPSLPSGGYRLTFAGDITLAHGDATGLRHGLIALAQMAHGARVRPDLMFPSSGTITDWPRHDWRGCHLDVARNFHGTGTVLRLIDILAWLRMNRLHWHLTDDEGWRLPSRAFQGLADSGGVRKRGSHLPPQYADGPDGQSGSYSDVDIAAVVDRAARLGVTVMPELDMPGHTTALLGSVTGLTDPDEPADSYRSIQGYPNNALNPALPRTYEVVQALLSEAAALFPGAPIHVGGDEVDEASWSASPAAQRLAAEHGLHGAAELEAHFMRRAHAMVRGLGRTMGVWDEAADGGGVDPEGTLLFAWRSAAKTAELIGRGYDVVATPGQAYYLDMVEGAGWDSPGTSWAGVVSPETTYRFEATDGLPDGPGRLVGLQACLWSEHLNSVARLNTIAFPRLAAVAEAAWTPAEAKDWQRFAALSRLVPTL